MSNKIERLAKRYEEFCKLPWEQSIAGPQKIWFAIYDKADERRLRTRISEFEVLTKRANHGWHSLDLTDAFGQWMAAQEYRESFFEEPDDLELLLPEFEQNVADQIMAALNHPDVDDNTVVAIQGIASLYGFTKVSSVLNKVALSIPGRLLVFFPGEYTDNNYRLLDARDGWNYLAIPIMAHDGAEV